MGFINRGAQAARIGADEERRALEQSYRLAYFIHGCLSDVSARRKVAKEIAKEALAGLRVAAVERDKRFSYDLRGQIFRMPAGERGWGLLDRIKGRARSKIYLRDINLLQCLVFKESEKVEREQEEKSLPPVTLDQEALLVRYLAHLVRITMERSSFYVALGLCRLAYSYGASETEKLYNFVIQDSRNRHKGEGYFRKQKDKLIGELQKRFGGRLHLIRGARSEDYFQRMPEPERFYGLFALCLDEFRPWEVRCCLPRAFNQYDRLPELHFDGKEDDDSAVELLRIHTLLHLDCFARLAKANKLDEPKKRLGLPLFYSPDGDQAKS